MEYQFKGGSLTLEELRVALSDELNAIRSATLDKFQRSSPGVSRVYQENLLAAQRYSSGSVIPMSNGMSPTDYLTGLGSKLGLHAAQFANYILYENTRLGMAAYQVEVKYLEGKSLATAGQDGDAMIQYVESYRVYCAAIPGA